MGMTARNVITTIHFANDVRSVRNGRFIEISFGLRASHGRHAGKRREIVSVAVTPECADNLMKRLARLHHD